MKITIPGVNRAEAAARKALRQTAATEQGQGGLPVLLRRVDRLEKIVNVVKATP